MPAGGRNAARDFRGQKRSNDSHASTTDPDARLYRKGSGQAARLCFIGSALMDNRNGLAVDGRLTLATGRLRDGTAIGRYMRCHRHREFIRFLNAGETP